MSTTLEKKETVTQQWFVVDADEQIVGRLATGIATVLMGKHKPSYTPHVDCGDYVIVVNAERVRFTEGSLAHPRIPYFTTKMQQKNYEKYTGYPGGRRLIPAAEMWERHPEMILQEAVRRMLPKNKLGRQMLKKLKLYVGPQHGHQAQKPEPFPEYLLPKSK
ncbi:MAG: 50S ribosomal protein L13 [Planctomycetaceae bacterium]